MDGVAFIARSAAKTRAKAEPAGQVVIHPIVLRYTFGGNLRQSIEPILDMIEKRLGWRPHFGTSLVERVRRLGEALLAVKEVEYFGAAQVGSRAERLPQLIDHVLGPLEEQYLSGQREATTVARIKKLRVAILPALIEEEMRPPWNCKPPRWRHLADCTFAQAASNLIRVDISMASRPRSVFWKPWNGSRKTPRTRAGSTDRCTDAWTLAKPCPSRPSGRVARPTRSLSNSAKSD